MAAAGACLFASGFSPATPRPATCAAAEALTLRPSPSRSSTCRLALTTEHQSSTADTVPTRNPAGKGKLEKHEGGIKKQASPFMEETDPVSLQNFFDLAKDLVGSDGGGGGGPPRWFSPLECSSRLDNSPLLLYLPGIDGTGAGLALQHPSLGKVFDIWCLHIPFMDRTSFTGLVKLVERTVHSESIRLPNRPIYVVGDSLGGCIALSVAARNPDIDLILILANPATSFNKSPLQALVPLLQMMPDQLQLVHPLLLSLIRGDPVKVLRATSEKGLSPEQTVVELSNELFTISSYIPVVADILPKTTLLWKLQMLKSASAYTNSRLHAVRAQILLLISGKDQLLPSEDEASRLYRVLSGCEIRKFEGTGHFLFLEDDIDLLTIIKKTSFYRRGRNNDIVANYLQPTYSEFIKAFNADRFVNDFMAPVMLSTLEDGTIVKGLAGVPSEGPVLLVGYHMLLGLELVPLIGQFLLERNIHVRGIAHPMLFEKYKEGSPLPDASSYDKYRLMGAVPVSGYNFFKLFRDNSHVLLYPGGMREALHRKGEQYKLFWPEQAEFVRMTARFGAKIVPFGIVGEDDFGEYTLYSRDNYLKLVGDVPGIVIGDVQTKFEVIWNSVVVDYDDLMKIPYFRNWIVDNTEENVKLRTDSVGEVAEQQIHMPGIMPKIPGRFYYFFGKPIDTQGRKVALRDREKSEEVYMEVKSEVEKCIGYLKEKREKDPYRSILSRLIFQTIYGPESQVPTFDL